MKIAYILAFLLIVPIVFAASERTNLFLGKSLEFEGKNISLVKTNFDDNKAIICVDGKSTILVKDNDKRINGMLLDLRRVNQDSIDLRVEYKCNGNCDSYVSNSACFPKAKETIEEEIIENTQEPECTSNLDCDDSSDLTADDCINNKCFNVEIQQEKIDINDNILEDKKSNQQVIGITLLIIVAVLGIILLMRKEKY